jgi:sensor histidine kinase YesM
MLFQNTKQINKYSAKRGLLMVVLIILSNGAFFLLNRLSERGQGAWKLLIINTVYCFVVWLVSERFLDNIGQQYPRLEDTPQRIGLKLATFFAINSILVAINTSICFAWGVWKIKENWLSYYTWTFGMVCFFGSIILAIYEGIYLFRKWKAATRESEQLKRERLQTQLDSLKNQVNPHFLFNSLNSLSSLIEEDAPKAQLFIHELARVYRYLLQSNDKELTDVKSELAFIDAYAFLLKTRFGNSISLDIRVSEAAKQYLIPPLTLQLLVENAVKHNVVSLARPLKISIYTEGGDKLIVSNNLQNKTTVVALSQMGLANIATKYHLLSGIKPKIEQTTTTFKVILPLLSKQFSPII